MKSEIEWIKQALKESPGKTQAGIAKALNLDRSSVSRLIKGERRLKYNEAQLIADYLQTDLPLGLSEDPADFEHNKELSASVDIADVRSQGGGYWAIDRNSIVGSRPRNDVLDGAPLAFGLFVPDNVMAPRFKIGELLWINPAIPAGPGDDALMVRESARAHTYEAFACEIEKISGNEAQTLQHGRSEKTAFDLQIWRAQKIMARR